jgi:hypothetical protein
MEPIITHVGWTDFGDYEHFGRRLYRDLAGETSFLGLVTFAVSGRRLSASDVAVLDDIAVSLHVPEPRVWPLKLARIAATSGRFIHGLLVGCAAMDSEAIGIHVVEEAALLLRSLRAAAESSAGREEAITTFLAARPTSPGFGVYGRRVDERVDALRACLTKRGRAEQPYWALVEEVRPIVQRDRDLDIHAWGAVAAALLDLGFEPKEMPPLLALILQSSYLAHAVDGARLKSESLRQLPPEAVRYVGPAPRTSPRALAAESGVTKR